MILFAVFDENSTKLTKYGDTKSHTVEIEKSESVIDDITYNQHRVHVLKYIMIPKL